MRSRCRRIYSADGIVFSGESDVKTIPWSLVVGPFAIFWVSGGLWGGRMQVTKWLRFCS